MPGLFARRGRPPLVAKIDFSKDLELEYLDRFHDACSTLRYRDIMALSRALLVNPRTIEAWKYGERRPKIGVILHVIEWVKQGKPAETAQPRLKTGMF